MRANISNQKESFIKSVKRDFLEFSSTTLILVFLTQTLELSIDYSFYRSVVVRLFLGDQSVVITKVFILFFEEADKYVRGGLEFVCELFV